jgi:hypothetical protein
LIAASFITFHEGIEYPGAYALIPTFGAAALVAASMEGLPTRGLAALAPLGKISYSLYLWHWPLIVFYTQWSGQPLRTDIALLLLALCFPLAWLSWRLVEQPARRSQVAPVQMLTRGLVAAGSIAGLASLVVGASGFPGRLPTDAQKYAAHAAMEKWSCPQNITKLWDGQPHEMCVLGAPWDNAKVRGVLWGDSHARHFAPLIHVAAAKHGISILLMPESCAILWADNTIQAYDYARPNHAAKCHRRNTQLIEWLGRNDDVNLVILASAWAAYPERIYRGLLAKPDRETGIELLRQGVEMGIRLLQPEKRTILILTDIPRPQFNVPDCAIRSTRALLQKQCDGDWQHLDLTDVYAFHGPVNQALNRAAGHWQNVRVLHPIKKLCRSTCPLFLGGELIYRDDNHLRRDLSQQTVHTLVEIMGLDAALGEITESGNSLTTKLHRTQAIHHN